MTDLASELRFAVVLLKNYADHDARNGDVEDAEYARAMIERMEKALGSQRRDDAMMGV